MVICKKCETQITVSMEFVGGCTCGPNDEYCYCPSKDLVVYTYCKCQDKHWKKLDILSDVYSIERFIQERLIPGDVVQHYK